MLEWLPTVSSFEVFSELWCTFVLGQNGSIILMFFIDNLFFLYHHWHMSVNNYIGNNKQTKYQKQWATKVLSLKLLLLTVLNFVLSNPDNFLQ